MPSWLLGLPRQDECVCCSLKQPIHTGRTRPLLPSCTVGVLLTGGGEELLVQMFSFLAVLSLAITGVDAGAVS